MRKLISNWIHQLKPLRDFSPSFISKDTPFFLSIEGFSIERGKAMGSVTPHGFSCSISAKRNLEDATTQAQLVP